MFGHGQAAVWGTNGQHKSEKRSSSLRPEGKCYDVFMRKAQGWCLDKKKNQEQVVVIFPKLDRCFLIMLQWKVGKQSLKTCVLFLYWWVSHYRHHFWFFHINTKSNMSSVSDGCSWCTKQQTRVSSQSMYSVPAVIDGTADQTVTSLVLFSLLPRRNASQRCS